MNREKSNFIVENGKLIGTVELSYRKSFVEEIHKDGYDSLLHKYKEIEISIDNIFLDELNDIYIKKLKALREEITEALDINPKHIDNNRFNNEGIEVRVSYSRPLGCAFRYTKEKILEGVEVTFHTKEKWISYSRKEKISILLNN